MSYVPMPMPTAGAQPMVMPYGNMDPRYYGQFMAVGPQGFYMPPDASGMPETSQPAAGTSAPADAAAAPAPEQANAAGEVIAVAVADGEQPVTAEASIPAVATAEVAAVDPGEGENPVTAASSVAPGDAPPSSFAMNFPGGQQAMMMRLPTAMGVGVPPGTMVPGAPVAGFCMPPGMVLDPATAQAYMSGSAPGSAAPVLPGVPGTALVTSESTALTLADPAGPDAAILKRSWTEEEDLKLTEAVGKLGPHNWSVVARYMSGRKGKQCRERWFNHLRPSVRKGQWSAEEDQLIFQGVAELGMRWSEIVKRLPGRTDNAIKNRYHTHQRRKQRAEQRIQQGKAVRGGAAAASALLSLPAAAEATGGDNEGDDEIVEAVAVSEAGPSGAAPAEGGEGSDEGEGGGKRQKH